jgi:antitoxin VapB
MVFGELVYTLAVYHWSLAVTAKAEPKTNQTDAKLFWNGRSQAVRLPKEFRFAGDRVRVTRMGTGILLEPLTESKGESVEEWFARIDALRGDPIYPEGRKQNLAPIREHFK